MKKILNSNSLKMIAIISMVIDHVALKFVSNVYWYFLLRFIGRIAAPVMFYSLAKGYCYTKNRVKYGGRLLAFAIISQIPYSLFIENTIFMYDNYNVLFTLFLSFLSLCILNSVNNKIWKVLLVVLCFGLTYFCDYKFIGMIIVWVCYYFKDSKWLYVSYSLSWFLFMVGSFLLEKDILVFLISMGVFLVLPLFYLDNGKKGKYNLKYLFYVFYPLHLLGLYFM